VFARACCWEDPNSTELRAVLDGMCRDMCVGVCVGVPGIYMCMIVKDSFSLPLHLRVMLSVQTSLLSSCSRRVGW
jgi:NhaP-type Na+/H+ and K+/H+ antiporter